jgi:hypothetical protein
LDLAEKGTPEFYRDQAVRLTSLAADVTDASTRLELLEIAAAFQRLAEHIGANSEMAADALKPQSA